LAYIPGVDILCR